MRGKSDSLTLEHVRLDGSKIISSYRKVMSNSQVRTASFQPTTSDFKLRTSELANTGSLSYKLTLKEGTQGYVAAVAW